MVNYAHGKIYRIICNTTGLQYIGSTASTLRQRLSGHKSGYNEWCNGKGRYLSSFLIIEMDDYDIVLIESYPCSNKDELHARERYWIEKLNCINRNVPTRSWNEYRLTALDKIATVKKIWYNDNRGRLLDDKKDYYIENRNTILQSKAVIVECECGVKLRRGDIARHKKGTKHNMVVSLSMNR